MYSGSGLQSCQSPKFFLSTCSTISRLLPLFTWSKMPTCGQLKIDDYEKERELWDSHVSGTLWLPKSSPEVWNQKKQKAISEYRRNKRVLYTPDNNHKNQAIKAQSIWCQQPKVPAQGHEKIQPQSLSVLSKKAYIIYKCGGTDDCWFFSNKLGKF